MLRVRRWVVWLVLVLVCLGATQAVGWWQQPPEVAVLSQLSPLPAGPGICPSGLSPAKSWPRYQPPQEWTPAHNSNYGLRHQLDVSGQPMQYPPLIVLHETAASAAATIGMFQSDNTEHHDRRVSYHVLIRRDGTVMYIVPPGFRAFGAAPSEFQGETVKTNPRGVFSVNNFAYHLSFESPVDGYYRPAEAPQPTPAPRPNSGAPTPKPTPTPAPRPVNPLVHSGYTDQQYQSLAWLIAKTCVPWERITTHKAVDTSGSRSDPRSFDWVKFRRYLEQYPRRREVFFGFNNE